MNTSNITVSAVIPIYNEEKYIDHCIESLLQQDYPISDMEWIFVDGVSTDKTIDILSNYQNNYSGLIRVIPNEHKTVPYAMNIGIKESCGKYIVRLDAHAEYAKDYISKCVYYLDTTDADNVGGVAVTQGRTALGNTIAKMLSSKFGVGNSQFRTGGKSGYVDTVPFGAFRREVFHNWGGYDERLTRNQDNEMNYRIRKNGGKIWLADDIHLTYYCRDTLRSVCKMAVANGKWNIITMALCPGSMGFRHFVPLMFVISLLCLGISGFVYPLLAVLLEVELLLYLLLDILFSTKSAEKKKEFFALLILFPIFHIAYGIGSMVGIVKLFSKQYSQSDYAHKIV